MGACPHTEWLEELLGFSLEDRVRRDGAPSDDRNGDGSSDDNFTFEQDWYLISYPNLILGTFPIENFGLTHNLTYLVNANWFQKFSLYGGRSLEHTGKKKLDR